MTHLINAEQRAKAALVCLLSAERKRTIELTALIELIYDELTNREVNGNYEISLETFNKITEVVNATGQD